ncbi:hypothetical protein BGX38DRAFT_1265060 [Terfezia claveryi]|nr:hypothetical protein BGX38DRAFT_1269659 [Terfezia claveryi]KAF8458312.1 hypothetical protein BGX38DRAFT_1265060 [Terfezia claveryi]
MSSAKVRVRPGPKAKSTALHSRSLTSLNVRKPKKVNRDEKENVASEWVDEVVSEVSKKPTKTRKSWNREFKLRTITMVHSSRVNKGNKCKRYGTRWVSEQLDIARGMLE